MSSSQKEISKKLAQEYLRLWEEVWVPSQGGLSWISQLFSQTFPAPPLLPRPESSTDPGTESPLSPPKE